MARPKESPYVRRIARLIQSEYSRPLSVKAIAQRLRRPPTYLIRVFKEQRGCGIRAYLVRVRMTHASRLLREGVKVEAVGLLVGYKSRPNFYRQFKKHFGITPAAFRKRVDKRSPS